MPRIGIAYSSLTRIASGLLRLIKSITCPVVKPTFHQDATHQFSYVNSSTWESPFSVPLSLPSAVEPKLDSLLIFFALVVFLSEE